MKGKEDRKITELAKERVAQKNNYGEYTPSDVISRPNNILQQIAEGVGVSLGSKPDIVNHNLELIKVAEQARIDMWLTDYNNKQKQNSMPVEHNIIDTGERSLEYLLEDGDNEIEEEENEEWELIKELFSSKKEKKKGKTTRGSGVKIASAVKTLESSDRKKKKKR